MPSSAWPGMDDQRLGPDLGRRLAGLLEDLARAVADVAARRADVDQVGRVDVDVALRTSAGPAPRGAAAAPSSSAARRGRSGCSRRRGCAPAGGACRPRGGRPRVVPPLAQAETSHGAVDTRPDAVVEMAHAPTGCRRLLTLLGLLALPAGVAAQTASFGSSLCAGPEHRRGVGLRDQADDRRLVGQLPGPALGPGGLHLVPGGCLRRGRATRPASFRATGRSPASPCARGPAPCPRSDSWSSGPSPAGGASTCCFFVAESGTGPAAGERDAELSGQPPGREQPESLQRAEDPGLHRYQRRQRGRGAARCSPTARTTC